MNFRRLTAKPYLRSAITAVSILGFLLSTQIAASAAVKLPANHGKSIRQIMAERGIDQVHSVELKVYKSKRILKTIVNGQTVKTYVFGLGKNPTADKTRRGDKATPIGKYYVCQKLPNSSFYKSLKISYPNVSDAQAGLKRGLINKTIFQRIKDAILRRSMPPMNTRLGGNICIHGGGAGKIVKMGGAKYMKIRDWTAGCMALNNDDMLELFHIVPVGTPVTIYA